MPRKPEVDIIDGVIFQSFDSAEGMQGCFQYRGPQLPVVVRRTSRERRITFKKDLLNQSKRSPLKNATKTSADASLAPTLVLEHAAVSSAVFGEQSDSDRPVSVDKWQTGHKLNYLHCKHKKHRVKQEGPTLPCVKRTSPVHCEMLMPSDHDASVVHLATDTLDDLGAELYADVGIASSLSLPFKIKKRKRRSKNCVYSGVKFGALSRRMACKPRKKLPHTATSLSESVDVGGANQAVQDDWMTPPDSQRKEESPGLPAAVKAVSRELFTTLKLPDTPPHSPPSPVKRKRRKKKKAAETAVVNNIVHDDVTDHVVTKVDRRQVDAEVYVKGQWKSVKMARNVNTVLQKCHSEQNCSVLLSPDSMDMPSPMKGMASSSAAAAAAAAAAVKTEQDQDTNQNHVLPDIPIPVSSPLKTSSAAVRAEQDGDMVDIHTDLGDVLPDRPLSTPSSLTAIKTKNKTLPGVSKPKLKKKKVPTATLR